jgi:hypothetical protein
MEATTEIIEIAGEPPEGQPAEPERIFAWRLSSLKHSGYDDDTAFCLASSSHVDLHVAIDLLAGGCSTRTAARILL